MPEAILEPDLPICDPHHHLWDFPNSRYLLPELLADAQSGHMVESTVFVECGSFYRAGGPEPMKFVGETEFVGGVAAMAASGRYGPVMACEGIVGRADLLGGAAVGAVLESHVRAGGSRASATPAPTIPVPTFAPATPIRRPASMAWPSSGKASPDWRRWACRSRPGSTIRS